MSNTMTRAWLALAGVTFAAFPLLRPFGDKTGSAADMAVAFADPRWIAAHAASMLGFVALALALRGWGHRRLELGAWLGAALVLPYYGAETFGLHAIGATAVATGDLSTLAAAEAFRSDPLALVAFAIGLMLVAAVGVGIAVNVWRGGTLERLAGIVTAAGLVAYLPQFFLPPEGRVAHGLVLALGLVALALTTKAGPVHPGSNEARVLASRDSSSTRA